MSNNIVAIGIDFVRRLVAEKELLEKENIVLKKQLNDKDKKIKDLDDNLLAVKSEVIWLRNK